MSETNDRIRVGDRVTIYKRGKSGIYHADFFHNDEHCRQSLKTRNKKTAVQRAVKLDGELIDGTFKKPPKSKTIASAIDDYLAYLKTEDRASKTIVRYRGELFGFRDFCHTEGVKRLTQIAPALFDRFRAEMKAKHKPKTLYHESMVIKQFLNWCRTRRLIAENPLAEYRLEEPVQQPKPAPRLEEVWQVLAAAGPQIRVQLAVLAFTGIRSGELQRLRQEDVELDAGWIHVVSRKGAETKTRESRKVPIHPVLKELLQKHPPAPGPWFFCAEPSPRYPDGDHHINPKKLNERFAKLAAQLELPVGRDEGGYTIHSLRHFFETFCVNAGIPQRVIDTWLGHRADKSMAAVYYSLGDEESQAFMRKVPFGDGKPAADAGNHEDEET